MKNIERQYRLTMHESAAKQPKTYIGMVYFGCVVFEMVFRRVILRPLGASWCLLGALGCQFGHFMVPFWFLFGPL